MRGTWWSRLVHLSLSPPLVLEKRPPTDNSWFFPPGKWQSPLPFQIPTRTRKHDCVENRVTVTKGEFWESFPLHLGIFSKYEKRKTFPSSISSGRDCVRRLSLTGIWDYSTVWHRAVRGWREIFKTGGEREGTLWTCQERRDPFWDISPLGTHTKANGLTNISKRNYFFPRNFP